MTGDILLFENGYLSGVKKISSHTHKTGSLVPPEVSSRDLTVILSKQDEEDGEIRSKATFALHFRP